MMKLELTEEEARTVALCMDIAVRTQGIVMITRGIASLREKLDAAGAAFEGSKLASAGDQPDEAAHAANVEAPE